MTGPDDDVAVDLLEQMLRIDSPSGDEQELATFLKQRMSELGLAASIDEVGNVVGSLGRPGEVPDVLLLSHLDTVPGAIAVRRENGYLFGRGACDAQGPLAAMIIAAARHLDWPGQLRVIGAVEEERLSKGGHHVAATQSEPEVLVVGEPGGWDRIVLGYKGKIDLHYSVRRPPTHSTNPRPKASEEAVRFWTALLESLGPDRDHASFGVPAATLREIRGGLTEAELDVDVRIPPGFDVAAFLAELETLAGDGALTLSRSIAAARHPRTTAVARALTAGIRAAGGRPRPTLKTGTSDMNTVGERWSVPAAGYGPGDSTLDHSDAECIEIEEFLRGITVLEAALATLRS